MPQISVVMPVYNGGENCAPTIESLLNQTYRDFELLAVNDGSTDYTLKVLQHYQAKDSRIRIINNSKNMGIVRSLNRGLEAAQGKYIARIDCGDLCVPTRLEEQYKFLNSNPEYVLVGSQAYLTDSNFQILGIRRYAEENSKMKRMLYLRLNPIIHPSVMFRRIRGLYYDDLFEYAEDHDMWFRMGVYGKFKNLPKPLIYYQLHEGISQKRRIYQIVLAKMSRQRLNAQLGNKPLHRQRLIEEKEKLGKNERENRLCAAYVKRHSKATQCKLRKNYPGYFFWKTLSVVLYPTMMRRLWDTFLVSISLPVNGSYRKWRLKY